MSLAHALRSEKGQAGVEYATLAVLVSIAAITVMAALGSQVQGLFQEVLDLF
jgi:Flp pilus assembly pilin Flp